MDERFSADQELIAENAALTQRVLDLERSAAEVSAYRVGVPGSRQVGVLFSDITLHTQTGERRAQDRGLLAILHLVGIPIFVKDNNHRFVLANRACCELFGLEEANVIGKTLAEHIPEHEMQHSFAVDQEVLDTGIPSVCEEPLTISNVVRTVVTKKTRFIDESGNRFLVGSIHDITGRKEVEGALVQSQETARRRLSEIEQIYAYSPIGLFVFDRDYRFLRINEYMAAINGCSVADHVGKTLDDIVPDLAGFLKEVYRPIFERGEPVLNVKIHGRTSSDANERDWIGSYFPLKSDTGEVIGLAAAVLEITAQMRAEHAQQRLADIVEKSLNEIYVFACDTLTFSYVNQSARDNLGYALQEMTALTPLDLKPEFTELSFRLLLQPLLAGERKRLEFETLHRRKDGSVYPVAIQLQLVVIADERVFVAVIADITERRQAEADKAALRTQLQQAQKLEAIGRLAGGVAHEFNNMLCVILGFTEMAMEQVDPDQPLHSDMAHIRTAATRAADVTSELLAVARKQIIVPSVLDLNEIVAGTMKMLGRVIGENIQVTWQPAADLWPIKADPTQIGQVVTNLCLNARDAISDTGHVTIETGNTTIDAADCAVHPAAVPGPYVCLVVSDDGCGMDQETLAQVFEPFFTTKDVGKGTGLGLQVVQGIVLQHGGFFTVSSEPGVGTTFRMYFPRHAEKTVEMVPPAAVALPHARGDTILVVEDEPALLEMTARLLEREGYTVLAALSTGEALRLAREHADEIHLLLTDVLMPEMNGQDLARRVVALRPKVRSLFMSGYSDAIIAERGVLVDAESFLQKPFTAHALAVTVRQILDRDQPRL